MGDGASWLLFSLSVISDSLGPHGLQYGRPPCPSPSPRVCSNLCPLSRWCHSPALSLSWDQGLFPVIQLFKWPKYWRFSFRISPSNEYSGLISFRIDWFDLLAVQGTLKTLLQHHRSKASILWHSAFFMVRFSHVYMTTGKTIALTIRAFVGKVMYLLFNTEHCILKGKS